MRYVVLCKRFCIYYIMSLMCIYYISVRMKWKRTTVEVDYNIVIYIVMDYFKSPAYALQFIYDYNNGRCTVSI